MKASHHPTKPLRAPFPRQKIQQIVQNVLRSEKQSIKKEINIIFVDNKKIRSLSKTFLNEDHETDVIAFPYEEGSFGDVFISLPMAKFNAKRYGKSYRNEVARLIIHGTLHLLGYSDHSKKDREKMWALQENLVRRHFS